MPNEYERLAAKQDLILRGLHLLIRTSYAPNEPQAQMRHFQGLQNDIAPWLKDYADAFAPESN